MELNCNLLQGYNGDGVAALEGFAKALDATLLLAFDVRGRLVDRLFQQARRWSGALLRALELDFLDDGAAITVGGDDGCNAGLDEEWLAGLVSNMVLQGWCRIWSCFRVLHKVCHARTHE